MGVFVAYYKFFPDRMILMFFVIPMRIKNAMWVMIALDILFANSGDAIAHFAHLGGVVAGFLYMAVFQNGPKVLYHSPLSLEGEVFYVDEQKRMDEILKKVERSGIQSLSESEREFLLKAGDRLRRRRGGF